MKFVPFDEKKIEKEFDALPSKDRAKLDAAVLAYEEGVETGYILKSYSDGIKMITDSGRGQGRCLYFVETEDAAVILKVYKKETQKVPDAVLKTARRRKKDHEQSE